MKSALVIVNWNGYEDTIECLTSLLEKEKLNHKIFLLDNGSSNESICRIEEWLNKNQINNFKSKSSSEFLECHNFEEFGIYFIKNPDNLGFSKGNNLIIKHIYPFFEYITMLNNDTVVTENALSNMVECMDKNSNIGILSCDIRLYSDKEKLWNAGGKFTWYGDRKYFSQKEIDTFLNSNNGLIDTPFVTGCVMMIRNSVISSFGVLTEQFFFGEEDFNYCYMLKKNKVVVKTLLSSKIYHKVNASISKASQGEKMVLRKNILHFTNRIINLKNFYSKEYWFFWKFFYLWAVTLKIMIRNRSIADGIVFKKYVDYYVKNNKNVDYNLFMEINALNFKK